MRESAIDGGAKATPPGGAGDTDLTLPMLVVWHARRDLRIAFDITTPRGRRDYRIWYGRRNRSAGARSAVAAGPPVPRVSSLRWRVARSLGRLPPAARRAIHGVRDAVLAANAVLEARAARLLRSRDVHPTGPTGRTATNNAAAPGVRIVGTVSGESGVGHALRSFAEACDTAGVPCALVDAGLSHPSGNVAAPSPAAAADPDALRGNVLVMPFERVGHAVLALGERAFADRTNVLMPYWELPKCPPDWRHAAEFVDEIWAPSRFIAEAVAPLARRVVLMPPCVPATRPAPVDPEDFGLARDTFTFFSSFDFLSYPERKNPVGAIAAFRRAFPSGSEPVALLMRVFNADTGVAAWHRLRDAARGDSRIRVSTRRATHAEVLGICAACDCYVSLHRSEGFGYGPAEAMLLGKPVIVTGWSGTCDYAADDNACVVGHELVAVRPDQYPHHEGCVWAEPDIAHAAWHMRRLVESPALAADIGRRGRETIRSRYAPEVVGAACRRRLEALGILGG